MNYLSNNIHLFCNHVTHSPLVRICRPAFSVAREKFNYVTTAVISFTKEAVAKIVQCVKRAHNRLFYSPNLNNLSSDEVAKLALSEMEMGPLHSKTIAKITQFDIEEDKKIILDLVDRLPLDDLYKICSEGELLTKGEKGAFWLLNIPYDKFQKNNPALVLNFSFVHYLMFRCLIIDYRYDLFLDLLLFGSFPDSLQQTLPDYPILESSEIVELRNIARGSQSENVTAGMHPQPLDDKFLDLALFRLRSMPAGMHPLVGKYINMMIKLSQLSSWLTQDVLMNLYRKIKTSSLLRDANKFPPEFSLGSYCTSGMLYQISRKIEQPPDDHPMKNFDTIEAFLDEYFDNADKLLPTLVFQNNAIFVEKAYYFLSNAVRFPDFLRKTKFRVLLDKRRLATAQYVGETDEQKKYLLPNKFLSDFAEFLYDCIHPYLKKECLERCWDNFFESDRAFTIQLFKAMIEEMAKVGRYPDVRLLNIVIPHLTSPEIFVYVVTPLKDVLGGDRGKIVQKVWWNGIVSSLTKSQVEEFFSSNNIKGHPEIVQLYVVDEQKYRQYFVERLIPALRDSVA